MVNIGSGGLNFRMEVDYKKVEANIEKFQKALGVSTREATMAIAKQIIKKSNENLAKDKKGTTTLGSSLGHIESSWKIIEGGHGGYTQNTVMNMSPYAEFVEWGTGIYQPGGEGLKWSREYWMKFPVPPGWIYMNTPNVFVRNGMVYLRITKGQPPKFFFTNAIKEVEKNIEKTIQGKLSKAFWFK